VFHNDDNSLKTPKFKSNGVNFGDRRILTTYLSTELNSVFGGGYRTCLSSAWEYICLAPSPCQSPMEFCGRRATNLRPSDGCARRV